MSRAASTPGVLAASLAVAAAVGVVTLAFGGDPPLGAPPAPASVPAYVPEACDVAIVLSGIERGFLEARGRTAPMRGGMNRRAALIDRVREKARAVGAFSLGEPLGDAGGAEEAVQSALKADLFRASIAAMGYGGSVLGITDLYQAHLVQPNGSAGETPEPPFNVKLSSLGSAAALSSASRVARSVVGPLLVRAVSVVDPTAQERLVPDGVADAVLPPAAALRALPVEKGLLIVAAHASREDLAQIRAAVEGKAEVIVIVDAGGEVAYDRPVAAHKADRPLVVKFDEHGREVGVLSMNAKDGAWSVAYRSVSLDASFEQGPSKARDEVERQFEAYRRRIREDQVLAKHLPTGADGPARYVGSAECRSCHTAIYDHWKGTPHARALETLSRVGSAWDPECVRCHTVGWSASGRRATSSFQTPDSTPHLSGVGCESCHGPGSLHGKSPVDRSLFGAWKGAAGAAGSTRDMGRGGCVECHDLENSPLFSTSYDKDYRWKVDHREVPKEKRTNPPLPPVPPAPSHPPLPSEPPVAPVPR